jgi:hypothetical protein
MKRGLLGLDASAGFSAYWPCEDAAGSTSIASGLPGGAPMLLSGTPGFQGQSGSPSADSVFACSAQLAQVGTSRWTGLVPAAAPSADWGAGFLLGVPSGGISAGQEILLIRYAGGDYLALNYSTAANGTLTADVNGVTTITGPDNVNGAALWVALGTGSSSAALSVLAAGQTAETDYTAGTGVSGNMASVTVNRYSADLGPAELGHLWVSPAPPGLAANAALLNAWSGETAANRFARLCAENGLTSRVYGYPDVSAVMGDQSIDTLANLLSYCEVSDRGMLYEPAETLGLGYRTLHSLCAQPAAVTLDYSQAQLGDGSAGLSPTDDDQYTVNDATVSRNNGSTFQLQVTDGPMSVQPPPAGVGDYATQVTVYTESDASLPHLAGWITHIGTADEERYPVIPLNLARAELAGLVYDLQDVRLGGYARMTNLLSQLPPGPASQMIYGTEEKLGGFWQLMTWNAVPETPYEVLVLDDPVYGHLDTDGSALASPAASTATTLSVATVNPASPLWTTDPADFPFDIAVAGEQITVTNITGASSPQSFTVTRSVNGVVKAQAGGTSVALFHTPVLALA